MVSETGDIRVPAMETIDRASGRISNLKFLVGLAVSILALAISAITLVTAYLVFSPELARDIAAASRNDTGPRIIRGDDLQVRLGTGKANENGAMQLTGLHKGEDDRAILTQRTSFAASDYSFIEYGMSGRNVGETIYLIWRTADHPQKVSNIPLHWRGDNVETAFVGKQSEWVGRITEIGFDIYGDLRGQPLIISNLTLLPPSRRELLRTVWSEWTAFRGWTQKSVNFLQGRPAHGILSPTPVMAAWSALTLVILASIYCFRRSHNLVAYASAVLIPWIALDLLWQANLSSQLEETRYLFTEKSQHEKHLADLNPELYQYAEYLKHEVLPAPGQRIFLLHDSEKMTYTRLKTQYYLLPHNIYNYDRFPRKKATRVGDYILVLGTVNGLEFSPDTNTLAWKGKSLTVKLVDSRADGSLFQVVRHKRK